MSQVEQILQQAMQLPPNERAYVADALEQSLPGTGFGSPDVAEAWATEIERRTTAYERGEIMAIDASDSLDRVRQKLAEFRARKAQP